MHGKGGADDAGRAPPRIAKFRSAEVSAPYVLACGSAAAEMPIKLGRYAKSRMFFIALLALR